MKNQNTLLLLVLALQACQGAERPVAVSMPSNGQFYELELVTTDDSAEDSRKLMNAGFLICNGHRELMGLPPVLVPTIRLPLVSRRTYILSNGVDFVRYDRGYRISSIGEVEKNECRWGTMWTDSVSISRNGRFTRHERRSSESGFVLTADEPLLSAEDDIKDPDDLVHYPIHKMSEAGLDLRCLTSESPPVVKFTERCVAEYPPVFRERSGQHIVLSEDVELAGTAFSTLPMVQHTRIRKFGAVSKSAITAATWLPETYGSQPPEAGDINPPMTAQ